MNLEFDAFDYRADTRFERARYRYTGSTASGWTVTRNGQPYLEVGPGFRLLRVAQCGICSTDLARHHQPFPLPQATGHELIGLDDQQRRYVVEINASHAARGLDTDCPFCRSGLDTHCPERRVLGIYDLPGGFAPWILAPVNAAIEIPAGVPDSAAVLTEPFAAALHAVTRTAPQPGETIAVLGPRRLGMLVVAALAAWRRQLGGDLEVLAIARRQAMLDLARDFGATRAVLVGGDAEVGEGIADVVIDTTGNPDALALALRLARREVHVKSTHGQPALGLRHLTQMVVDEIALAPFYESGLPAQTVGERAPVVAWLSAAAVPRAIEQQAGRVLQGADAAALLATIESGDLPGLPRADVAVVDSIEQIDAVLRPRDDEISLVRPRGSILLRESAGHGPLGQAITGRRLTLSSSRCGDFGLALEYLAVHPALGRLGETLITHHFGADDLEQAFAVARSPACIKAVVEHRPPERG